MQIQEGNIKKIIKQTEIRFGRGSSGKWRNKDFEDLSFEINQKAKILISPATLKRIFGKVKISDAYTPQESTLKALIIYSGYTPGSPGILKNRWLWLTIFTVLSIVILMWFFNNDSKTNVLKNSKLELIKVEGSGPASAYFIYDVPESKDSVFLNFGDGSDLINSAGFDKTVSHFYGYPGYFSADLQTRKEVLTEPVKVFIPTRGWQALCHYFENELIDRYYPIPLQDNTKDGIFHGSRKNIVSLGIDSTKIIVVRIDNYQKTNKPGDSFVLQSRFKNDSFWSAIRCFSAYFSVQGTKGKILIKFVGEGCSNYSEYVLGERKTSGSVTDLSCFTVNLQQWSEIEIRNNNKNVSVSIADSVVFDNVYSQSIGEILGTTVMFHGSGSLDYIYLKDLQDNSVFIEDFE